MMMLQKRILFSFAQAALVSRTYQTFQKRYQAERNKVDVAAERARHARKASKVGNKVYVHPCDDVNSKPHYHFHNILIAFHDLVGPEQVSTHYEHFSYTRRQLFLTFAVPAFLLSFTVHGATTLMVQSMAYYIHLVAGFYYFWIEGNKRYIPTFRSFYRKIAASELINMETYWAENIQSRVRKLMAQTKSQIQSTSFLSTYNPIKQSSLINFIISEQQSVKNHLHSRALTLLKEAEAIQEKNKNAVVTGVLKEAANSVDQAYKKNKAQIDQAFFELALAGIAKNRMQFKADPILPYVNKTIENVIAKYEKIPKEQREKQLYLSQNDLKELRSLDAKVRDQFLNAEPTIDPSLKLVPPVAKMMEEWGIKKQ